MLLIPVASPLFLFVVSLLRLCLLSVFHLDCRPCDPMPPHHAHAPGRSDDTEAHTNTAQGAAHANGAGTCTTADAPRAASAILRTPWSREIAPEHAWRPTPACENHPSRCPE